MEDLGLMNFTKIFPTMRAIEMFLSPHLFNLMAAKYIRNFKHEGELLHILLDRPFLLQLLQLHFLPSFMGDILEVNYYLSSCFRSSQVSIDGSTFLHLNMFSMLPHSSKNNRGECSLSHLKLFILHVECLKSVFPSDIRSQFP